MMYVCEQVTKLDFTLLSFISDKVSAPPSDFLEQKEPQN